MAMLTDDRPRAGRNSLEAAACLFHGFSDPSRLVLLRHLALGPHRVVDLVQHVGLAQSTVSKHLACLRECGLVTSRPSGRASVFTLAHPEALLDLFAAADRLLELTGEAVTLCPTSSPHPTSGTHPTSSPRPTTPRRTGTSAVPA